MEGGSASGGEGKVRVSTTFRRILKLTGALIILLVLASTAFYGYIRLSSPNSAEGYIERGVAYALKGDYYSAVDDFDRAIEMEPGNPRAYYHRGVASFGNNDYSSAWDDFNKAIGMDPDYAKAYYGRAVAYYDMSHGDKRFNETVSDYEKAVSLGLVLDHPFDQILDQSNIAWAYLDMGYDYRDADEHTKAISAFSKGIEIDPNLAFLYDARGYSYYILKDYNVAVSDFTKGIELEPNAWNYRLRGSSYSKLGDHTKALSDYGEAIAQDPDKSINHLARAEAYLEMGEYQNAVSDYSKAINMEDNPTLLWLFYSGRGETYEEMGDHTRAKRDFETADKLYNQVYGSSLSTSSSSSPSSRGQGCKAGSACVSYHVGRALAGY